jgi:hypothetical protein
MDPTSTLLYRDQETAERIADEWRARHMKLIASIRVANSTIDSLKLERILDDAQLAADGAI